MIDIEKEKELHAEWYKKDDPISYKHYRAGSPEFEADFGQSEKSWLAAKSKAIPEGFVLVSQDQAKDTERLNFLLGGDHHIRTVVQRDIENEDYEKIGEHYLFTEVYWIDGWDYHENTSSQSERGAIDMAIEAQEQSHE